MVLISIGSGSSDTAPGMPPVVTVKSLVLLAVHAKKLLKWKGFNDQKSYNTRVITEKYSTVIGKRKKHNRKKFIFNLLR